MPIKKEKLAQIKGYQTEESEKAATIRSEKLAQIKGYQTSKDSSTSAQKKSTEKQTTEKQQNAGVSTMVDTPTSAYSGAFDVDPAQYQTERNRVAAEKLLEEMQRTDGAGRRITNTIAAGAAGSMASLAKAASTVASGAAQIRESGTGIQSPIAATKASVFVNRGYDPLNKERSERETEHLQKAAERLSGAADKGFENARQLEAYAKDGLGDAGQFLVDLGMTGTQMAGDALANAIVPGGGLASLGARSFGGAVQSANEQNIEGARAGAYGIGSAAVEIGTEMLANIAKPLKLVYGTGVVDKAIQKVAGKLVGDSAGRRVLAQLAGSAGSEALEEVISNVAQVPLQNLTLQNGAAYDEAWLEDTLYSALLGGALGGVLGVANVPGTISRSREMRNAEKLAREMAEESVGAAESVQDGTETGGATAGDTAHIDRRDSADVGSRRMNAFQYDHPEMRQFYRQAAEDLAADAGISMDQGQQVRKVRTMDGWKRERSTQASAAVKAAMDMGLTRADIIRGAEDIVEDSGKENNANAKRVEIVLDDMLSNGYSTMFGKSEGANADYIAAKDAIGGGVKAGSWEQYRAENRLAEETGEVSEAELREEWESRQRTALEAAASAFGNAGRQVFQAGYRSGSDSAAYFQAFQRAYNEGLTGAARSVSTLSETQADAAYKAGKSDAARTTKTEKAKAKYATVYGEKSGVVYDEYVKGMDKKTVDRIGAVAKKLGVKVQFVDSVAGGWANAEIQDGMIRVEKNNPNPVLSLLGHEWTHRLQQLAPKEYNAFRRAAYEAMENRESEVYSRYRTYAEVAEDVTMEEALDELAADYAGELLENGEILDEFIARSDRSLLQKVLDALREFVGKLTGAEKRKAQSAETKLTAALEAASRQATALQGKENGATMGAVKLSLKDMTEGESAALLQYKSSESYKINAKLRDGVALTEAEQKMVADLDAALEKLPVREGTVYRRLSFDMEGQEALDAFLAEHAEGDIVPYEAYTSSSTAIDGYPVSGDLTATLVINSKTGRDMAGIGNNFESEVVFPRGCDFIVERVTQDAQGSPVIYMKEDAENGIGQLHSEERVQAVQQVQEKGERRDSLHEISETDTARGAGERKLPGVRGEGKEEVRFSLKEYTDEEKKQHIKDAAGYFGRTYKWAETGYVTTDGRRLDFSGRHDGGPGGYRTVDHRDIREALGDDYGGDDYSGGMVQFMSEGNIRIAPENGGINLSVMPTEAQMSTLSDFISKQRGEVILDLDTPDGRTVSSTEYPRGTHANKVLADIKEYFENGTTPYVSEMAQFRYSLKGSRELAEEVKRLEAEGKKKGKSETELRQEIDALVAQRYGEMLKAYGPMPRGEKAYRDVQVPKRTEDHKGRRVSQTVRTILEAEATPEEAVPRIEQLVAEGAFTYDTYTDKQAMKDARAEIEDKGFADTMEDWLASVRSGAVSKRNTALGWALYNNCANSGDLKGAVKILNAMVEHQRSAAQALQATRILKKLSPEGQLYGAQRSVDSLQREMNERYGDKAPNLKIDEELAQQFLDAKTQGEREAAMKEIYKDIGRQMPTRWTDRWRAWRYLAMLGNPRTHVRNIVGNAGFTPVIWTKDAVATAIEAAASKASGGKMQRSKGIPTPELISAAAADYANVRERILSGGKYNESNAKDAIEEGRKIFGTTGFKAWDKTGGRALEKARKGNSRLMELEDMVFSKGHYALALAQYCKANGISAAHIRSGKLSDHARAYAILEAQKATYRDTNDFSEAISRLGRYEGKNGAKKALSMMADGVLPFRKTPANILVRGVEYSPLGFLKGIGDLVQAARGKGSAAEAIDQLSAGLTGTGLLMLGAFLATQGFRGMKLRGGGDDDDKQREFDELNGHQNYALELADGTSVTLDWLAPEVLPLFVGANLAQEIVNRDDKVTMSGILGAISKITDPMLEMSCLSSLNELFDSVGYATSDEMEALPTIAMSATTSLLTQAIPTLAGQAERTAQEGNRITTYTDKNNPYLTTDMQYALGRTSAKIPGWDYNQIPYIDAWGRQEAEGKKFIKAFNNFLNPAYMSKVEGGALEEELQRLYDATGSASVLPQRADKTISVNGEKKSLTAKEYVEYATAKGQKSRTLLEKMTGSKSWAQLSDSERVEAIKTAYSYADAVAKGKVSDYKLTDTDAKIRNSGDETLFIMAYATQKGITESLTKNGKTIVNSNGLFKMQALYQMPGVRALSDDKREILFLSLGVGKTVAGYSEKQVESALKRMKKTAD